MDFLELRKKFIPLSSPLPGMGLADVSGCSLGRGLSSRALKATVRGSRSHIVCCHFVLPASLSIHCGGE